MLESFKNVRFSFSSNNKSISFHKSTESQKLMEAAGCKLLFLPPYSPDLNPIEKYWANMKVKDGEILSKVTNFTDALEAALLSM